MNDARNEFALDALAGTAVGDGLGECFSYNPHTVRRCIAENKLPPKPWWRTDDSEMAIAIVETLMARGEIDQDLLATRFAAHFATDRLRGYGAMAYRILAGISAGGHWRTLSQSAFGGSGSFGNGAAMRVAPLGAWFHDDLERTAEQATLSATVTHAHPEGIAGAVAVAVAAAVAASRRTEEWHTAATDIWANVVALTPAGKTREGIERARALPANITAENAAKSLGCGFQVSAQDTVPFVIWSACKHLHNFERAFQETAVVGGDVDTTCAMVGGIVAAYTGRAGIPELWFTSMEPWPDTLPT